jgi:hypothetical protein
MTTEAGFPDGSYGRYVPFKHPTTQQDFHVKDSFDVSKLGYKFESLPDAPPSTAGNMREMPVYAVFPDIVITEMEQSRWLHVFVMPASEAAVWTPPATEDEYFDSPNYAGDGCIFGLFPPGGCPSCKKRPPFNVSVDITAKLRELQLVKADATIRVMVANADGTIQELKDTPVPLPQIRGPLFESLVPTPDISGEGENHAADVEALQRFLVENGYKTTDVLDGQVGDQV